MFGFPKLDHSIKETFKRNFLRTVVIQFKFDETDILFKNKGKISSIFQENYPRLNDNVGNNYHITLNKNETPIVNTTKGKGFLLKSSDGNKTLNFINDTIEININGLSYKNFAQIKDYEIEKIKGLLKEFGITKLNRVAIRKINIIGLKIASDNNLAQITKDLMNERFSEEGDSYPMEHLIQQNIKTVNYLVDNDGLNLKSGYVLQPNQVSFPKLGHIICDIDRYNNGETNSEDLSEVFKRLNEEIFDIFLWFLSSKSIQILTNE